MARVNVDIRGYRQLSDKDQVRINEIKALAEKVGKQLDSERLESPNADLRWCSIARTNLQQGFMAWIRAIAKPETF